MTRTDRLCESNVFKPAVFTPSSLVFEQHLRASRALNLLPTRTDALESRLPIAQRPRLANPPLSLNQPPRSPGSNTPKGGSLLTRFLFRLPTTFLSPKGVGKGGGLLAYPRPSFSPKGIGRRSLLAYPRKSSAPSVHASHMDTPSFVALRTCLPEVWPMDATFTVQSFHNSSETCRNVP